MPCTRSMRSKPSTKQSVEVEAPAPKAKTRSTRTKKGSKREDEPTSTSGLKPSSPALSTHSTRSRTRARAPPKVDEDVEMVDLSESPPKTSRGARTKTSKAKQKPVANGKEKETKKTTAKSKKQKEQKEIPPTPKEERRAEVPIVLPTSSTKPLEVRAVSKKKSPPPPVQCEPKPTVKKETARKRPARGRARDNGDADLTESDDLSTDQEECQTRRRRKALTVEQLHKHVVLPIRTAFQAVETIPIFMEAILDTKVMKEQEEEFQKLLHRYDMPPPPAPIEGKKARGRTRKKRARSPEQASSKTEVPQSFNFTEVQAKKKLMMDSDFMGNREINEGNSLDEAVPLEVNANAGSVSAEETETTVKVAKFNALKHEQEHSEETQEKKEQNAPSRSETVEATGNDPNATFILPSVKAEAETKSSPNSLLNVTVCIKNSSSNTEVIECEPPKVKMSKKEESILTPAVASQSAIPQKDFVEEKCSTSVAGASTHEVIPSQSNLNSDEKKNTIETNSSKQEDSQESEETKEKAQGVPECSKTNVVAKSRNYDPNATFVLPPAPATVEKKINPHPLMNVTVCIEKSVTEAKITSKQNIKVPVVAAQPLRSGVPPLENNDKPLVQDSRTFIKETSTLTCVMEEEDEEKDVLTSSKKVPEKASKNEPAKKGLSSSSSSSCSSMKSATSQPSLFTKEKKQPNPTLGSAGKPQEVYNSKPLEEAERRRQEILKHKAEASKKKREDWEKKRENKQLEDEKKLREKQKLIQPPYSNNCLPKKHPSGKIPGAVGPLPSGFMKPKTQPFHLPPPPVSMPVKPFPVAPSLKPSQAFPLKGVYKAPPPPQSEADMDDSFKSASATNCSYLDATVDGPLNSYDITMYEDLDEDLKHRENKPIPNWASERESLKIALFSMVYLSDYEYKYHRSFPKTDRNFKLFPNK